MGGGATGAENNARPPRKRPGDENRIKKIHGGTGGRRDARVKRCVGGRRPRNRLTGGPFRTSFEFERNRVTAGCVSPSE